MASPSPSPVPTPSMSALIAAWENSTDPQNFNFLSGIVQFSCTHTNTVQTQPRNFTSLAAIFYHRYQAFWRPLSWGCPLSPRFLGFLCQPKLSFEFLFNVFCPAWLVTHLRVLKRACSGHLFTRKRGGFIVYFIINNIWHFATKITINVLTISNNCRKMQTRKFLECSQDRKMVIKLKGNGSERKEKPRHI